MKEYLGVLHTGLLNGYGMGGVITSSMLIFVCIPEILSDKSSETVL